MSKKYEMPENEPQMVSESDFAYAYNTDMPVVTLGEDTGMALTTTQLHRILELSDSAIANGDVFTHDEVMQRLKGYSYGCSLV